MLDRRDFGRWRQDMFQVLPTCRIIAAAITAGGGPVQNQFDAQPHAVGGDRSRLPEWTGWIAELRFDLLFEDIKHPGSVDSGDIKIGEFWVDVSRQCADPGVTMLSAFPAASVGGDIGVGAFLECLGRCRRCCLGGAYGT